ncbi:hypothetical protein HG536_0A02050 [Torulaspora globosa]|uniref:glucan endo-1,3-beta-D-glucosidase n=1 Tax=Torulaspora globosa TaxID=48254 RepID=A0A7G3ZA52_9SACH|nr:uncharacterized protein HG536_0A02050 [Torulaspora globosa]QLL30388.1 hypothetical protein HG536_0A02050 [Torulaspora globosa]
MNAAVRLICVFLACLQVARAEVSAYDQIAFSNVGFAGTYTPVKKFSNIDADDCSCEVGDPQWFSGTNAPVSSYLSVHFRGPLKLHQFAYYDSPSFDVSSSASSSDFTRRAYYNASAQVGENVTFLTAAGDSSKCLGKALTYAGSDGTSKASSATLLQDNNYISSDEEFIIFSNVSCPKSGVGKGCGYYRQGIPAYYGFGGVTKMFLFDFEMPRETQSNSSSIEFYDLPAIWLLNDHIPRTAQYPTNPNCSCWASGCGEFDIFEAMNGTERDHFYSTFHTFQGIEYLGTGIQSYGYIPRDTRNAMRGGAIFDSTGNVITFLSNATKFDSSLSYNDIHSILSAIPSNETYSSKLMSISATAPSTTSKSSGFSLTTSANGLWYYLFTAVTALAQVFVI